MHIDLKKNKRKKKNKIKSPPRISLIRNAPFRCCVWAMHTMDANRTIAFSEENISSETYETNVFVAVDVHASLWFPGMILSACLRRVLPVEDCQTRDQQMYSESARTRTLLIEQNNPVCEWDRHARYNRRRHLPLPSICLLCSNSKRQSSDIEARTWRRRSSDLAALSMSLSFGPIRWKLTASSTFISDVQLVCRRFFKWNERAQLTCWNFDSNFQITLTSVNLRRDLLRRRFTRILQHTT